MILDWIYLFLLPFILYSIFLVNSAIYDFNVCLHEMETNQTKTQPKAILKHNTTLIFIGIGCNVNAA